MQNKTRVVITGIGVIASNAIGKKQFFAACSQGVSGIKPITLFETSNYNSKLAGEVSVFKPEDFLGAKGLRTLDRSTKLLACATKLALDDANISINEENSNSTGFVAASTLGSIKSISDFDRDSIVDGVQYVNPAFFPNTVINSPASEAAIKFNLKCFNATIASGFSSGIDAIKYACDFISLGRAKAVLAGGVEELCIQTFLGFLKTNFLSSSDKGGEICAPFDKRRNGTVLGEGVCVFALESLDSALERGAHIYGEVKGYGVSFDGIALCGYNESGEGMAKAMSYALSDSNFKPSDIDCVFSSANSDVFGDRIEAGAIKKIFSKVSVTAIKSILGETFSAAGAFQVAAACLALEEQVICPTLNYIEKDPGCLLDIVNSPLRKSDIQNCLLNAFGVQGTNSSLVISKIN